MNCVNCRASNPEPARFCQKCGFRIVSGNTTAPKPSYRFFQTGTAGIVLVFLLIVVLAGSVFLGGSFGPGFLFLIAFAALFGGLLRVALWGRLPGKGRRLNKVARVALGIFPLAVNGFAGALFGSLSSCRGDFFCAGRTTEAGIGIGIAVFLGMIMAQLGLFWLVWSIISYARGLMKGL